MSDALWDGRRYRTFNVVDDFNRQILAIEADFNLPAARVVRTLEDSRCPRLPTQAEIRQMVQGWCRWRWLNGPRNMA